MSEKSDFDRYVADYKKQVEADPKAKPEDAHEMYMYSATGFFRGLGAPEGTDVVEMPLRVLAGIIGVVAESVTFAACRKYSAQLKEVTAAQAQKTQEGA